MVNVAFIGGNYVHRGRSIRGGVAVSDGTIVAVGDDALVRETAGPDAEIVDTSGRLLSAGFIDAHLHPAMGGREIGQCDLSEATSAEDAVRRIADYAAANPDLPWIEGGGWSMDHFDRGVPAKEMLDRVLPDRPVLLSNRDHHASWANSAALRLAGIDAITADPEDGRIERTETGDPQGTLHEGAATLVRRHAPVATVESLYQGLLRGQAAAARVGITGWQDALLHQSSADVDGIDAYRLALERGTLHSRVVGAIFWDRGRGLEQIEEILERSKKLGPEHDAWFRASAVKIIVDGVMESFTASVSRPYIDACGHETDNHGISFLDKEMLRAATAELDRRGLQVHFHALGDRAVTDALDAVEHARRTNPGSKARHHLAHLQVVQERDVPRFARLGAVANLQPLWARHEPAMDELTIPFLPTGFAQRQYPFRDLLRSGARLAAGSDWPVSSMDPLDGIHVAVNRVAEHSPAGAEVFLPEQRIPLGVAWDAYTSGSAYVNGRENETGRLRVGYRADLVVLDRDPFAGDPLDIAETSVLSTWVDGRRVYTGR